MTRRKERPSSRRWLERQKRDPYVALAERRGYRSRAAFKLLSIDDSAHLLRPGAAVVDLGAAPGGWTQVAVERTKPRSSGARIVAVDIQPLEPVEGATVLELDVLQPDAPARIREVLGRAADVVLSDMAPATTGHRSTDHLRSLALAETALALAEALLAPGGAFLVKIFQGGGEVEFERGLRARFEAVRRVKPEASRAESREIYILAKGFKPKGV
ncbi:MAG: RlmE family RNA methyltransferase [Alphaproteobacteria bacterium]